MYYLEQCIGTRYFCLYLSGQRKKIYRLYLYLYSSNEQTTYIIVNLALFIFCIERRWPKSLRRNPF